MPASMHLMPRLSRNVAVARNVHELNACMQIDFNLYGMGLLRLGHVLFRHPVPAGQHIRHGWSETPVLAVSDGEAALYLLVLLQALHNQTHCC